MWQPHGDGLLSLEALESGETLRKVAAALFRRPSGSAETGGGRVIDSMP
jgi:hypothetical protein